MRAIRAIDLIKTHEDLAEFIRDLQASLNEESSKWENTDLSSFLEAMAAWLDDMDGYYKNRGEPVPTQPDWKFVAGLLKAASVYE